MKLLTRLASVLAVCLLALPAQAQVLPQQLLNQQRGLQGNNIRACVDDFSPGGKLDRAVAQAIADALFLKVEYVPALRGFPLDGDGYLAEMQVHLTNDCDLLMGVAVQPNSPFPEWAAVTRPYANVPFVLAVADPSYTKLGDIPVGSTIGTAIASLGERVFATTMLQRPKDQRWKRLPYADNKLMLTRLLEGKLAGMLLWQPALAQLMAEDPAAANLKVAALDPVPAANVQVGALIASSNTYLRSQVDNAIAELTDDGTITQIMADLGMAQ